MPRYRLRTLLILLAIGSPVFASMIASVAIYVQYSRIAVPPNVITVDMTTGEVRIVPAP